MATPENHGYSPFWGLLILTWAIGTWLAFHIVGVAGQEQITRLALREVLPRSDRAIKEQKRYISLVEDLRQTALSDANAKRILADFHLQPPAPKPASP